MIRVKLLLALLVLLVGVLATESSVLASPTITNESVVTTQVVRNFAVRLKIIASIDTPGTEAQVRQELIDSGLRTALENGIQSLAATDPETTVLDFEWELGVHQGQGEILIYPKVVAIGTTTRTELQLLNALTSHNTIVKTRLRTFAATFPSTSINWWHYHEGGIGIDEIEL